MEDVMRVFYIAGTSPNKSQ